MKALVFLVSALSGCLAWMAALIDFAMAKLSPLPRPYLVPGRAFYAAFRMCAAFLEGRPVDRRSFRLREYPRPKYF